MASDTILDRTASDLELPSRQSSSSIYSDDEEEALLPNRGSPAQPESGATWSDIPALGGSYAEDGLGKVTVNLEGEAEGDADSYDALDRAGVLAAATIECRRLLALAVPLVAQNLFGYGVSLISLLFVGRLGVFELSAAVLASSGLNITGFAFLVGLASAMETLCGQAYGARHYALLGVTLQRGLLICMSFFVVGFPFWTYYVEPLLLICGQDPAIAAAAARYIAITAPSLAAQGLFQCLTRYLAAQNEVYPQMWAAIFTTALAPAVNWLLVFKLHFGLDGAAYSTVFISVLQALVLLLLVIKRDRALSGGSLQTWHGWSSLALKGWPAYMKLAIPSAAMICTEWLTFEVMILLAGLLPNPSVNVDTTGIFLSLCSIAYMFPLGIAGAVSTRVSNELGAVRPSAAKLSVYVTIGLTLIASGSCCLLTYTLAEPLTLAFSSDAAVKKLAVATMPILAAALLGDGVNAACSGVVRGAGRQALGAACNVVSYWVVGIPLSVLLAFHFKLGVAGLWLGLLVATSLQGTVLSIIVLNFDWQHEAERTAILMKKAHLVHRTESGLDLA